MVTELAGNLVRHARQGELILSVLKRGAICGVEVLSVDRGPGVVDFRRCLTDGFSTVNTPGNGLGAVVRMADEFDVYSVPDQGTALVVRIWASPLPLPRSGTTLETGAVCLPVAGEQECGDAWAMVEPSAGRSVLMVADGLGHGPAAALASSAAIETLRSNASHEPAEVLQAAHQALRGTRGAAVAVALVDQNRRQVKFSGVGNISAVVIGTESRHGMVSHSGTIGMDARKFQEFIYPWMPGSLLLMHSDGLSTQWKLERRSPLASSHLALIAGSLYREHGRIRDDVTVVVARNAGASPG